MTILTGSEIHRQWQLGHIRIDPFDELRLNPNSYNFTLGNKIRVYISTELDARVDNPTEAIEIPDEGLVLESGRLYLGQTREFLGGNCFAPTFSARSSIARLGLNIHLSSGLGDIGYYGQWTLQLQPTQPVRVYPGMEIGQMMWWTPEGDITEYDGKYQGACGPRASMSYRTLDRDIARTRFPDLRTARARPEVVGAKFANLARMAEHAAVPDAVVVPIAEFSSALPRAAHVDIATVFADIQATVGNQLTDDVARLEAIVAGARLRARTATLLTIRLHDVFGADARLAVRSSAVGEDSETVSHAGAYDSYLDVAADDVAATVERVWRSYYSLTAVTGRVRVGDLDPIPKMAVIVQRMVEPDAAGIAMTGLDPEAPEQVRIEAVVGRGDALAAGIATPHATPTQVMTAEGFEQVRQLVHTAGTTLDYDRVDVEWAYADGRVYLLQARRNTVAAPQGCRAVAAVVGLYDGPIPGDIPLGSIGASCLHFVGKRGRWARVASELGIARGGAYLLYLPAGVGFDACYPVFTGQLDDVLTGRSVILDASEFVRQVVTTYEDLREELERLRAATPSGEPLTVLVREYVTGEAGMITRRTGANEFYAETSPAGLLAMNRGTADTTEFSFSATETPTGDAGALLADAQTVARIATFTDLLEAELGPVAIEWVIQGRVLYYVDHTVLGDSAVPVASTAEAIVISPGRCTGRVLSLVDDEVLQRLSVASAVSVSGGGIDVSAHREIADIITRIQAIPGPVILHARKPYAILAVLTEHVAGFLFDSGSLLCHLSIILREQRVPSAVHHAENGQVVMLDDGHVHSTTETAGALS